MKKFSWRKIGLLFSPNGEGNMLNSHAQIMAPIIIENKLRIFFSSRPNPKMTLPFYADFDVNTFQLINVNTKPILELGKAGTFDEHGIMPSCIVKNDDELYLYYSGWQQSVGVPYNNYTGLAISKDNGKTFKKYSSAPVLDRNGSELYSATSPFVLKESDIWHTWYSSGTGWHKINGKLEHTYDLKYAYSKDGKKWHQEGKIGINNYNEFEALCKPAIIKLDETFYMWFSYRGSQGFRDGAESYRIGLAYSNDLINWKREDKLSGIDVSKSGWDSMMVAYPSIIKIKDQYIMFYNGNSFGKDGFGYAILDIN